MLPRTFSRRASLPALLALALIADLGGCASVPRVDSVAVAAPEPATKESAARAAAVRSMRIQAAAGETSPYPNVFAVAAADVPDPAPMSEVAASENRLARAAYRQPRTSAAEIRAGEARTAQLRRLGKLRAKQAELAIQAASKKP